MIPVGQHLELRGIDIPILATDKFPDLAAMVELSSRTRGRIRGSLEPLGCLKRAAAQRPSLVIWDMWSPRTEMGWWWMFA